jgi:2-haloacid dehalogenase
VPERPKLILFDSLETLFSPAPLGARLVQAGLGADLLPCWLSRLQRDGFALEIAGLWRPFHDVAGAALAAIAADAGHPLDESLRAHILAGWAELPAHSDVRPALEAARAAGVGCACLTNGASAATLALLQRAGLDSLLGRIISADEIQHWKPLWDVYLHAADALGHEPHHLALVSAHDWDLEGARQAGLTTGWVARSPAPFSPLLAPPDVTAGSLLEAVERLLGLPPTPELPTRPPTETLH